MNMKGFGGIIGCIISGLGFGIYWLPIRALEKAGIAGIWAVVLFSAIPLMLCLPLLVWRWRKWLNGNWRFHASGALAGLGFSLYVGAYLYTDVIHALVLYYMMPIWGFLLGWLVLGEKITPLRWLAMALALAGLACLIPSDFGLPVPRNVGDWMALCAGMMWACVALILYMGPTNVVDDTLNLLLWSMIAAGAIAALSSYLNVVPTPQIENIAATLWWLVPLTVFVILPTAFATMYGPSQINPGIAGLLFMIEISVGTVTAALLTDEAFGWPEIIGVSLIFLAGIVEPLRMLLKHQPTETAA